MFVVFSRLLFLCLFWGCTLLRALPSASMFWIVKQWVV
jgi:hypothetical protein